MKWLLTGGEVYTDAGMVGADVLIEDGRVTQMGEGLGLDSTDSAVEKLDCRGCWIGPGLVDVHTHFREPGQEWKEDVGTATAAAAAGGYTGVVGMPNTDPPIDSGHLARFVIERGRQAENAQVGVAGCITRDRQGQTLSHIDELWDAGVRIFTDDGDPVQDAGVLRHAMEYIAERGGTVAQHAEDQGLVAVGCMHEGEVSDRLGMTGRSHLAEEIMIARDLALVRLTGARYHCQHLSSAGSVELIAAAKSEGLAVSCEVTPHHLAFDHRMVETMNPDYKMHPPLRTPSDRQALVEGLAAGVIDMVATDHAPHAAHEREVPFEEAPPGVIGLETAIPVVLDLLGAAPELLFERMSVAPAELAGWSDQGRPIAVGNVANLVVIDPTHRWVPNGFVSRSENSPWLGTELVGWSRCTFWKGQLSHQSNPNSS